LLFSCVTVSYAEQIAFTKRSINGKTSFHYKWYDKKRQLQELDFKLPSKYLRESLVAFKPFDNRESNDYVYERMKEHAEKNKSRLADVRVKRVRNGFELEANGRSKTAMEAAIAELKEVSKKAMDEYVDKNYYKYMDEESIRPDHARIIHQYVPFMRPVAEAISENVHSKNPRDVVNYALSFMQAIPYDILRSRYTSNGAGFQMPYGLLYGNKGDCDTKSVALAAILRNFYPRLRMMMVYVPGHAFVGLAFPPESGDRVIYLDGQSFVLAEPVGPNQSPLGVVSEQSLSSLSSRDYFYEEVPF
jgi:hypothetical protein